MSEKFDILYDIDMQLYNEFNDTLCEINEHLGDIYSYKDKADVEDAEKSKEIQLLREAVEKLQKELEKEKKKRENAEENYKYLSLDLGDALKELGLPEDTIIADELVLEINNRYISKDKIKDKIEEIKNTCYYNEGDATAVEQVFILEKLLEG